MQPGLRLLLLFTFLFTTHCHIQAQLDTLAFSVYQDELLELYNQTSTGNIENKATSEQVFLKKFNEILSIEGSVNYHFSKLPSIGRVSSRSENLVIHSWNFQDKFGYSNYYCIIQFYSKKEKTTKTFSFQEDKTRFIKYPEQASSQSAWYGSLYYEIVETKYKGTNYYTLMGFNFHNVLSNKKVLETIYLNKMGDLEFAQNIFVLGNKKQSRVVFEFAERARMTLKYDPILKMIVADNLTPQKPSLEGQFQFYGPDGSYDAFDFIDGIWVQKTNIEIKY